MPRILSVDIETYSSAPLPKCGVYRYVDAPDFEILLFSYAYDDESVQTIDMVSGEKLPPDVLAALEDPATIKMAYNANFERVCLSKCLGHWLDPAQWRCSAVMAATLTLPARLADVAVALKLTQQKMEEGKDLIRFFSIPCKATKTNGGRTRNLPQHAPEKWETYKQYNAQDVETERAVRKALEAYPMPESEWALYALDQRINDRGVRVDRLLVKNAMAVDQVFSAQAFLRAKELTGLENPGSVSQLKAWLADQDMPMESLAKKVVQETAKSADGIVKELLDLRLDLSKTSIKKYEAMARCVCRDGRVHGMLQFGGASRTMRWAGRLVQAQNLPQNHLPDLSLAREIVKAGDAEQLETLFGSVPSTLSELIRTAFIPKDGCRFIVADFSAIEARVLAWLAGEEWVLEEFRGCGKIYEATASRMFSIPADTIVKGNLNYEYRQKGKQATLSCGYGGGVGALKAMGAKMPEEEMQPLVDAWRAANPHIVGFWSALDRAACEVIEKRTSARVGRLTLFWQDDRMFIQLPAGRRLCYISPRFVPNRFGNNGIGYLAPAANGQLVIQETFGGKLAENCTQSIARDLLAHGMVNLEAAGYPIVFHVHDEAVMEMPIGHVGYYVGNGYAVEWKGFAYGCVKTKVAGRGWTHWYELPFIKYGAATTTQPDTPAPPATDTPVTNTPSADIPAVRNLFYKSPMQTGADVQRLQTQLNRLGFDCGTADGIFGKKTRAGVKTFQAAHHLEVDGIVGKNTRAALEKAVQSLAEQGSASGVETQPEQDEHAQGATEAGTKQTPQDVNSSSGENTDAMPVTIRIKMTRAKNSAVYGTNEIALDIEEYLRGVVPSEMYESANMEALKAQAIAARTYAYRRRSSLLSDTANHQAFRASRIGNCPHSDEAVSSTKGQVLTYNGKVIDCFYSASNNGQTKRSGDVWSTHYPYYVSKPDEWDEAAREGQNVTSLGHGVGMSQHGAMWAARHGVSHQAILAFYYEGCAITDNYNQTK